MKRKLFIKVLIIFCVVNLLQLNFAAVISDNDGSAFISKAEFDSLKNNFQNQIDKYDTSIDSKIDDAIASYLAGISISKNPTDIYGNVKSAIGGDFWVKNSIDDIGKNESKSAINVNLLRRFNYKYYDNLVCKVNLHTYAITMDDFRLWAGAELLSLQNNDGNSGRTLAINDIVFASNDTGVTDSTDITVTEYMQDFWEESGSTTYYTEYDTYGFKSFGQGPMNTSYNVLTTKNSVIKNAVSKEIEGDGKAWIYHTQPDGTIVLREFAKEIYPIEVIELDCHTYKSFADKFSTGGSALRTEIYNYYTKANGKKDDTSLEVSIPQIIDYGVKDCGETKRADDSTSTTPQKWWQVTLSQMKTTDLIDYSIYQWGKNCDTNLYCIKDNESPTTGTQTTISADETKSNFPSLVLQPKSQFSADNELSGVKLTYYPNKLNVSSINLSQFSNQYLASIVGNDVKIGGGFPIAKPADKNQEVEITLSFKCRDNTGASVNDTVYFQLSDKQFTKGALSSGAKDLSGIRSVTTGDNITINVSDVDEYVWINMYAGTDGYDVAINNYTIKEKR